MIFSKKIWGGYSADEKKSSSTPSTRRVTTYQRQISRERNA